MRSHTTSQKQPKTRMSTITDLDECLHDVLSYDPDTGHFFWEVGRQGRVNIGDRAGCLNSLGRYVIRYNGKLYLRSRLAWLYTYGCWPEGIIDHVDGNPTNDKLDNLRDVSRQVNAKNSSRSSSNTSGVTGVSWYSRDSKWSAYINTADGKKHLGYFEDKEDAVLARKSAEEEHNFHPNHGREKN